MLEETKDIVFANIDFLPLKSYTNIVEGNALKIDWETIVPKDKLSYIIGNPPFIGHSLQIVYKNLKLNPYLLMNLVNLIDYLGKLITSQVGILKPRS